MPSSNSDYTALKPDNFKCNPYNCAIDGSGGMGDVYKAFDTRTNETVAVKILKQSQRDNAAECVKEGKQLRIAMACPYVVNLIGILVTREITGLVMEYAENGSLDTLIHNQSIKIEKDLKFRFLSEIVSGIHFIHNFGVDQRVLHRDIKPKNILLDMDFHVKIGDFGTSVCSTVTTQWKENRIPPSDSVTTLRYCAPERIKGEASTSKVDIYAFGVSAGEIIIQQRPYVGERDAMVRSLVLSGQKPNMDNFPLQPEYEPLRQLIHDCLHYDREQRPDALAIKKMLKTNCPFDHVEVARQVYELHTQVPKKAALTEEMATQSLITTVNKHNQRFASQELHAQPNQHWQNQERRNITPSLNGASNQQNPQRGLFSSSTQQESRGDYYVRSDHQLPEFYNNSAGNFLADPNLFQKNPFSIPEENDSSNRMQHQAPRVSRRLSTSPPLNNQQYQNTNSGTTHGVSKYLPKKSSLHHNHRPKDERKQGTSKTNQRNGIRNSSLVKIAGEIVKNTVPQQAQRFLPSSLTNTAGRITQSDFRPKRNLLKCVVLGDSGVGKEDMINCFLKRVKRSQLLILGQYYNVKVEKGSDNLRKDCDVVVICFSPASRQSYNHVITTWMDKWRQSAARYAPVLLVMTQTELHVQLDSRRRAAIMSESECEGLAKNLKVDFEEYRTNDYEDAEKVFKKAFNIAANRL